MGIPTIIYVIEKSNDQTNQIGGNREDKEDTSLPYQH